MISSLVVTASTLATSTFLLIFTVLILPILYFINFYLHLKRHQAATPWSVKEKVVLITGASSGIGEELAYEFSRQGATLILCARRIDRLTTIAQVCKDKYGAKNVTISKTDVTRESDVVRLIETVDATYEKLDCLVLNAGVSMGETLESLEDFNLIKDLMNVNYFGSAMFAYHSLPLLKKAEKSRIVVVSSLIGIIPSAPLRTGYAAAKCALKGFFESLQTEIIDHNIFISIAYPGVVATEINKNRLGKNPKQLDFNQGMSAEECAKMIVDGTINGQKEINLTSIGKISKILDGIFPELLSYLTLNHSKRFIVDNDNDNETKIE